ESVARPTLHSFPTRRSSDLQYLTVIIASALLTVAYVRVRPPPGKAFLVADAVGLALFALSGAQLAEAAQCPAIIVVLMGTMTGVDRKSTRLNSSHVSISYAV